MSDGPAGHPPDPFETAELPGLPREPVTEWLRATLPDLVADGPWTGQILAGGLSNITYRLCLTGGSVVLRRPPLGNVLPSAHDMAREFTVQSALAGSGVPVPAMLALCDDYSVIGTRFYVMADVPGVVLRSSADTVVLTPATRTALSEQLVRTLVDLHSVDPDAAGLSGFGRADGYCARQVRRWGEQWERSATRELPDMARLLARLSESVPASCAAAIVHGDYRLDNTVVDLAGPPRINSILDWEMSTLGDPLADLGLFLTYWYDSHLREGSAFPLLAGLCAYDGFPDVDELAQAYATHSGRDLTELGFYRALGAMKLAVILEGVHARFLGGRTVSPGYEQAGPAVPVLTARALRLLP